MFPAHVEDEPSHPPVDRATVEGKEHGPAANVASLTGSTFGEAKGAQHYPPEAFAQARPPSVLCVEDSTTDLLLIQEHLAEAPYPLQPKLHHAPTLQQAIGLLEAPPNGIAFDCILLDLSLPDSYGPETFATIRRASPNTAIIVLTGREDDHLALEMVRQGAQDYLSKDQLTGFVLSKAIRYAIERQRLSYNLRRVHGELEHTQFTLEQAQRQLIQADKLDSIGRMAAGVAHEVKNPLGVLQMGVDYFREKGHELDEMDATVLNYMQDAISRADTIIHEMLNFSRANDFDLRLVACNKIVESSLRMVNHDVMKRKLEVVSDYASDLPLTRANEGQLQQVLINILLNAAQAVPIGGRIEVRTFLQPPDATAPNSSYEADAPPCHWITIEIRDYGPGIPEEVLQRMFEPFFTTKPRGEGTGLGLCVVKRILEIHGGRLQVTNMDFPTGARFRILLRAEAPPMNSSPTGVS